MILWVFGLFVIGAFNLNFLHFQDIPLRDLSKRATIGDLLVFFQDHPGKLALLSLTILLVSVLGLLLTNWSKIMLILSTRSILETKRPEVREQGKKSAQFMWPTVKVSLLTSALMVIVAFGLLGAPFLLISDPAYQILFWILGSLFFIPLAFTISCLNIFTFYFIVIFKHNFGKALNLGTDFFVTNWSQILGLTFLLIIIYGVSFMVGVSLIFLTKIFINLFSSGNLGNFGFSAMLLTAKGLEAFFFWLLLAGLNVFLNTALLLFFLQMVTPVKGEEPAKSKEMFVSPVAPV